MSPKDNIKTGKGKMLSKRRYFQYLYMRKDSSIICKELLSINKEKRDNTISKMGHRLEQPLYKRGYPNEYSYKDFLGICREEQIKTIVRYYCMPTSLTTVTQCWWGRGATRDLIHCRKNCKLKWSVWKTLLLIS